MLVILLIMCSSVSNVQGSILVNNLTITFDQLDFGEYWNNQTEEVLIWSNSTPIFENQTDQVALTLEILETEFPISIEVVFRTKILIGDKGSNDFFGNSYFSYFISVGNIKSGSKLRITVDWTSLLNESHFNTYGDDPALLAIKQYQILLHLETSQPLWDQISIINFNADVSTRERNLHPHYLEIDISEALFEDPTISVTETSPTSNHSTNLFETEQTNGSVSFSPIIRFFSLSFIFAIIIRRKSY